jgi:capsular exopolysaccharide synthesis family protein
VSEFFKALKKAEQEGVLRGQTGRWQDTPTQDVPQPPPVQPQEAPVALPPAPGPEGTIPHGVNPHLVTLLTPTAFEAEQYRMLGHLLEQMRKETGLRVVAISSPTPGDGKTSTSINLAGILARDPNIRVLLVEAELRRPSVCTYLGLGHASGRGLVHAILDPTLSLEHVVQQCQPFNLSVLPAGRALASPHAVLKSPRLGELLDAARQCYDYVIVDTPPLVFLADCQIIEQWIDGFLVIVTAHKTPRKLLAEALNVIDPAKVVGLVFNKDEDLSPIYYSYHYAHYAVPSSNGHRQGQRAFRRR